MRNEGERGTSSKTARRDCVRTSPVSSIKIALDWDAPLWLSSMMAEVGSTNLGAGDAIVLAAKKLLIDCFVDGAAVGCAIGTHYQTAQSINDDRRFVKPSLYAVRACTGRGNRQVCPKMRHELSYAVGIDEAVSDRH